MPKQKIKVSGMLLHRHLTLHHVRFREQRNRRVRSSRTLNPMLAEESSDGSIGSTMTHLLNLSRP
jgi:hypothetical protein